MKVKTISDYLRGIESENIDVEEGIRNEIKNIEEYNSRLNAFISIFDVKTSFDISKVPPAEKGLVDYPLYGIPITIKDNISLAGHKTTAGSAVFQDFVPSVNADAVDLALASGSYSYRQDKHARVSDGRDIHQFFFWTG